MVFQYAVTVSLGYRLFDVWQMALNVFISESLRNESARRDPPPITSIQRTGVVNAINYVEIIVIFAILFHIVSGPFDSGWGR